MLFNIKHFFSKLFIKSFYEKKYFLRLLFAFTILAFVIILSTSFIFTSIYMKNISDQLYIDYNYSLSRLSNEFDNIFLRLVQTSISLKQNSDINKFLTNIDKDYDSISRADIYLSTMKNFDSNLDSIILYNKNNDITISSGILLIPNRLNIDIKSFTEGHLSRFNTKSDLTLVASTMNPNITLNKKPVKTVSIIFSDSIEKNSFDNAIIITIDPVEINRSLFENYDGITIITDDSGEVVFDPYNYETENNISKEAYFKKIKSLNQSENNFRMKVNDDNKIITYTKSLKTGFYIINMKSLASYSEILKKRWVAVIFIGLLIILFFSVTSFFLSKKMYKPIKTITDMFSNSVFTPVGNKKGEIDFITNVYKSTVNHLNELEDKHKGNNSRLKEEFLKLLLKSNIIPDNIKKELEDYDLFIKFSNLILVSLAIDNINYIDDDKLLGYETTLCKIIPELIIADFNTEIVNFYNGELALLLNFKNTVINDFDILVSNMDKIRNICRETLQITLTIGIGSVSNSLEECCEAYSKAEEMIRHRFVFGFDRTIYKKFLDENLTSNLYYPIELENQIISSIKSNNEELFEKHLQALVELLNFYPYSEAVTYLFQIITTCLKTFNQMTIQDNQKYSLKLDEFSSTFSKFQNLNQVKAWLINIYKDYQHIMEGISQLKNNKHYNQIQKIQDYIKQNYHNINLSAESISEVIGYSPYYFTKVFKDITGMNINDYIRQIRIAKVKELLSITDYKINEIPNMVGFTNASHFFAVFKKDVGLTPAAFREYILESKDQTP